jgi:hypothetical protein
MPRDVILAELVLLVAMALTGDDQDLIDVRFTCGRARAAVCW